MLDEGGELLTERRGVLLAQIDLTRRLGVFAKDSWREQISAACAAHAGLGPASPLLYDCSTLYFGTGEGDGFREPGFPEERRLASQIAIGVLTGAGGFPLMVGALGATRRRPARCCRSSRRSWPRTSFPG